MLYTASADVTVGVGGSATVTLSAMVPGSAGNAGSGITLTLSNPIVGLSSVGVTTSAMTGGTDVETDSSLRTRMNQKYAAPPQGGAVSDYVTWALSVPGVTRAWCRPNGAGNGTVVIYTMLDVAQAANNGFPQGTDGVATLESRDTAATGDQLNVANLIHPLRPATALVYSCAPLAQPVNVTIANLLPNTTAIQTGITAALKDLFVRQGTPLGGTIYPSDINAAVESVSGITRFTLVSPSGPVTTSVGYLPTVGTLVVS